MTDDGTDDPDIGALETLERDECLALAQSVSVGRIAWSVGEDPPVVVPVNFSMDHETVVFRSDPGAKLDAIRGRSVSFQVDFVDPFHRTGWSVLLHGVADVVTGATPEHVHVESWSEGSKPHWIRIEPTRVSGRRIRLPEIELDPRGYL